MDKFEGYNIIYCETFFRRFMGLMFKKNIRYGLLFKNCNSIHTFFMKENIDVIFLDKKNNIIKRHYSVKPWNILICKKASSVLEIPSKK